jgi:hypothetical protein
MNKRADCYIFIMSSIPATEYIQVRRELERLPKILRLGNVKEI